MEDAMSCGADAFDVLEFGEALVAARPSLRAQAEPLAPTPEEADRLVERALKRGWVERRSFRGDGEVSAWLADKLLARH
jgi:DNA-directed RNA polymerase specialized sigma24 family protein